MSTHCHIARVRPKASPQLVVHILPPRPDLRSNFVIDCRVIRDEAPIAGYAVVAWHTDGSTTTALLTSAQFPYSKSALPMLVGDAIRRHDVHDVASELDGA